MPTGKQVKSAMDDDVMLLRSLCTTSDDGNEDNNNYAMRTQQHTTQLPVYSTKRKHIYNNL